MQQWSAKQWKDRGKFVQLGRHRIFVIDEGKGEETIIISHGYPSCSFDYWKVLGPLSKRYRVIVHDHLGFGFSDKPRNYSYTLIEQAQQAMSLWEYLGVSRAHLIGHDYGTSVVCEIVYQWNQGNRPIEFDSVTVGNGSMLIQMANLLLSQKLLMHPIAGRVLSALGNRPYVHHNFKKLWGDKSRYDRREVDVLYDIGFGKEARRVLPKITQYIQQRYEHWDRWLSNGLYETGLPVNIYWGDKDPIAVVDMAYELQKQISNSRLSVLDGVGHYPMLEAPERWRYAIETMLAAPGRQ